MSGLCFLFKLSLDKVFYSIANYTSFVKSKTAYSKKEKNNAFSEETYPEKGVCCLHGLENDDQVLDSDKAVSVQIALFKVRPIGGIAALPIVFLAIGDVEQIDFSVAVDVAVWLVTTAVSAFGVAILVAR